LVTILISPLQTLTLYNAVANNGSMMKPYLVSAIQESGITVKENQPVTPRQDLQRRQRSGNCRNAWKAYAKTRKAPACNTFKNFLL
jgi:membrane carboxypeptidase/penicillin-binding protein